MNMQSTTMTNTSTLPPSTQAEVVLEHSLPECAGTAGMAFDGEALWFLDGPAQQLVRVHPDSGAILKKLDVPGATAGTTFDGRHLWQVAGLELLKLNPEDGRVLARLPVPFGHADSLSGLAWGNGMLWLGEHPKGRIHKIDPETGRLIGTLELDRVVTGIEWVEGELWHGTHDWANVEGCGAKTPPRGELRRVDPATGRVFETLRLPEEADVAGIAADRSGRLWCGDVKLRALSRRRK